ncbi:hypothetical protein JHW43_008470 [Diplocarpon mali]|nr:hypothetical protein JHW43_008470 [Diplocarpon mali]
MVDPLSVTVSTVALAQLCTGSTLRPQITPKLYKFTEDISNVATAVHSLYSCLTSLSQALNNISIAWKDNLLVRAAQVGPDARLWICVKDSLAHGTAVLKKLKAVLDKVPSEMLTCLAVFTRSSVKRFELNLSKEEILDFRSQYIISEQELLSTKDEELRVLTMENQAFEQKLGITQFELLEQKDLSKRLEDGSHTYRLQNDLLMIINYVLKPLACKRSSKRNKIDAQIKQLDETASKTASLEYEIVILKGNGRR